MKRIYLILIVIALLSIVSISMGATRNYYITGSRITGNVDSLKWFLMYANGDSTKIDSTAGVARTVGFHSSTPNDYDTLIVLPNGDSTFISLIRIWWAGMTDPTDWTWEIKPINEGLRAIAEIDTMMIWAGWQIGAKYHTDYSANGDTIWVVSAAGDTLGIIIFQHVGGAAGDQPDTVKVEAKP